MSLVARFAVFAPEPRMVEPEFAVGTWLGPSGTSMPSMMSLCLAVAVVLLSQVALHYVRRLAVIMAPKTFSKFADASTQTEIGFFKQLGYEKLQDRNFFVCENKGRVHLVTCCAGMNNVSAEEKGNIYKKPLKLCAHCLNWWY